MPTQTAPSTKPSNSVSVRRLNDDERFILRQLNGPRLQRAIQGLRKISNRTARMNYLLNKFGDYVQISPDTAEDTLYDELVLHIESCRHREHGAQSQINLVHYISTHFIPWVMAYANGDI